jgi:hypothetical protein
MTKYPQAASSVNHPQQDNHDSDHQQNVNETTHGVRSNHPQQPQDKHNDGNGIKHDIDLSIYLMVYATAAPAPIGLAQLVA